MLRTTPYTTGIATLAARQGGRLADLFGAISEEARLRFERFARVRVVAPKTVLLAEGSAPEEIGFVLSGILATSKLLPAGRSHILGLLLPTDMYGRLQGDPIRHRVEALSDARLLVVPRVEFERLLSREPEAGRLLLLQAQEELDAARDWAVLISEARVVGRVASFLVALAGSGRVTRPPGPVQVRLRLARSDLASYLGTRPETLSRAFHELADRRMIRILDPYRFELDDLPALREISNGVLMPGEGESR
jgi:CRP/FNR family transcriptional regulator, anaerobic regulatory protein